MTGTVRSWPLRQAVSRADLGRLGPAISQNTGQSLSIQPLQDHPGWLAKIYRQPRPPQDADRLDWLVSAPQTLSDTDRTTLLSGSSWPAARIFEPGNPAFGCVIPAAPERFKAKITVGAATDTRSLELDWLAKPDDYMQRVGIAPPGDGGRIAFCLNVIAVAAVLEKLGVVYSDWSYSNAFWSPVDRAAFVIDIDGCQTGKMPNIHQPHWTDPLTPEGGEADGYTDRYRLALLVARCLTGQRDARAVSLIAHNPPGTCQPALQDVLLDMLLATDRERRPTVAQLHLALSNGPYVRPQPKPARMPVPASQKSAPPKRVVTYSSPTDTARDRRTTATRLAVFAVFTATVIVTILILAVALATSH